MFHAHPDEEVADLVPPQAIVRADEPLGHVRGGRRMPERLPDFGLSIWHGLYAPRGTPAPVVERLAS